MISVPVTEASQVADVRRRAVAIAHRLGFDETASGRVAIVTTELATNLVKYGSPGEILLSAFEDETGTGVEVIALDRREGLRNIDEALRDGHSTGGSGGTGLGAVRRQSQAFDIASWPGRGTAVLARVQAVPKPEGSSGVMSPFGAVLSPFGAVLSPFGAVAVPMRGEVECGDAYCVRSLGQSSQGQDPSQDGSPGQGWTVVVADGLGHGVHAADASGEAIRLFRDHEREAPGEILGAIHAGLRHTRGGAVSVARYDAERATLVFAGIGNVSGAILAGGETKRLVSLAGTAGHAARRIQEFEHPFGPDATLVMHSDGIATNWSLERYPGLTGAHPSLIAAVMYRDFARGRDDATVLVARGLAS